MELGSDAADRATIARSSRRGAEHKSLIAVAVVLAAVMQVIDSSIVSVTAYSRIYMLAALLIPLLLLVRQPKSTGGDHMIME